MHECAQVVASLISGTFGSFTATLARSTAHKHSITLPATGVREASKLFCLIEVHSDPKGSRDAARSLDVELVPALCGTSFAARLFRPVGPAHALLGRGTHPVIAGGVGLRGAGATRALGRRRRWALLRCRPWALHGGCGCRAGLLDAEVPCTGAAPLKPVRIRHGEVSPADRLGPPRPTWKKFSSIAARPHTTNAIPDRQEIAKTQAQLAAITNYITGAHTRLLVLRDGHPERFRRARLARKQRGQVALEVVRVADCHLVEVAVSAEVLILRDALIQRPLGLCGGARTRTKRTVVRYRHRAKHKYKIYLWLQPLTKPRERARTRAHQLRARVRAHDLCARSSAAAAQRAHCLGQQINYGPGLRRIVLVGDGVARHDCVKQVCVSFTVCVCVCVVFSRHVILFEVDALCTLGVDTPGELIVP